MHLLKFSFLFTLLFLISCDDGDIIESEFDFDTDDLEFCYSENDGSTVFYNYNSDATEVIYIIINEEFDGIEEFDNTDDADSYAVGTTDNIVEYVKFNSDLDTDEYFCTTVASTTSINRELSGVDGTIDILTTNEIEDDDDPDESGADEDGDGLSNVFEGYDGVAVTEDEVNDLRDTDGDGIPDFRDEDDDNDNVNTSVELYEKDDDGDDIDEDDDGNPIEVYLDTDGDGILDYLDDDDDNDGVPTRLEFTTGESTFPTADINTNSDGVNFYLDSESDTAGVQTEDIILSNSYTTNFETIVKVIGLSLDDSSGNTSTYDSFIIGEENISSTVSHIVYLKVDGTFETYEVDDSGVETLIETGIIGTVVDEN